MKKSLIVCAGIPSLAAILLGLYLWQYDMIPSLTVCITGSVLLVLNGALCFVLSKKDFTFSFSSREAVVMQSQLFPIFVGLTILRAPTDSMLHFSALGLSLTLIFGGISEFTYAFRNAMEHGI